MQSNSSKSCAHYYNVEILNLFDPELQLINTKPVFRNKLKELFSELKSLKFKEYYSQTIKSDCEIFHSSAKLIAGDSDMDETFKSMHKSVMTKIKKIVLSWMQL